jgi:steroid delta-isomerase-like uncharacterized protein
MSTEENKALIRRYWEENNKHNVDIIDELMTTDYVQHDTTGDMDLQDVKAHNAMTVAAIPNVNATIEDIIDEGDRVAVRMTMRGTQKGEFRGIQPTGKTAVMTEMSIYRISEGKIAEGWDLSDRLGLMQQLGAIPRR